MFTCYFSTNYAGKTQSGTTCAKTRGQVVSGRGWSGLVAQQLS